MQRIKRVIVILFCVMLLGASAASLLLPDREFSDRENRSLEGRPDISLRDFMDGSFQENYEKYLNDQMFLRDWWVRLAVSLERAVGRRDINGVYVGRDGYLLEKSEPADFDDEQVEENIRYLSDFLNDAVSLYGRSNVTCMLIPSKTEAQPDKMPHGAAVRTPAGDVAEALAGSLQEPAVLLDITAELQEHQNEYIYYRTDHHWTTLGAYYAYRIWAERTGHAARPLEEYTRERVFDDFYGTTYNKLPLSVPRDSVELFHSPEEDGITIDIDGDVSDSLYFEEAARKGFNRYDVFFSKNTAKITIQTKAQTGKRLLVVKDSFANCFVPFLLGHYDEIIMIDCRYSKKSVGDMLAEQDGITDVLVLYNIDKFMQNTDLRKLDTKAQKKTMEEFNADDFFEDLE